MHLKAIKNKAHKNVFFICLVLIYVFVTFSTFHAHLAFPLPFGSSPLAFLQSIITIYLHFFGHGVQFIRAKQYLKKSAARACFCLNSKKNLRLIMNASHSYGRKSAFCCSVIAKQKKKNIFSSRNISEKNLKKAKLFSMNKDDSTTNTSKEIIKRRNCYLIDLSNCYISYEEAYILQKLLMNKQIEILSQNLKSSEEQSSVVNDKIELRKSSEAENDLSAFLLEKVKSLLEQKEIAYNEQKAVDETNPKSKMPKKEKFRTAHDYVILLQHVPTYTLGTSANISNLLFNFTNVKNINDILSEAEKTGKSGETPKKNGGEAFAVLEKLLLQSSNETYKEEKFPSTWSVPLEAHSLPPEPQPSSLSSPSVSCCSAFKHSQFHSAVDIYRSDRGGDVTYHGPGQIVLYAIIDLRYQGKDVNLYIRKLEEVVLETLRKIGINRECKRISGMSGVWVESKTKKMPQQDKSRIGAPSKSSSSSYSSSTATPPAQTHEEKSYDKISAVGIKVRRWVTMHGLSLNVFRQNPPDVNKKENQNHQPKNHDSAKNTAIPTAFNHYPNHYFDRIVACGLKNKKVTFINDFIPTSNFQQVVYHLIHSFQDVFNLNLINIKLA